MTMNFIMCGLDRVVSELVARRQAGTPINALITIESQRLEDLAGLESIRPQTPDDLQGHHFTLFCPDGYGRPDLTTGETRLLRRGFETIVSRVKKSAYENVLIQCRDGNSRSPALAIALRCAMDGNLSPDQVIQEVFDANPYAEPNLAIIGVADRLLGAKGTLIESIEQKIATRREVMKGRVSRYALG